MIVRRKRAPRLKRLESPSALLEASSFQIGKSVQMCSRRYCGEIEEFACLLLCFEPSHKHDALWRRLIPGRSGCGQNALCYWQRGPASSAKVVDSFSDARAANTMCSEKNRSSLSRLKRVFADIYRPTDEALVPGRNRGRLRPCPIY